jgi:hypothetical protein
MGSVRRQLEALLTLCHSSWPPSIAAPSTAAATEKEAQNAAAFDPFGFAPTVTVALVPPPGVPNSGCNKPVPNRLLIDQAAAAVSANAKGQKLACSATSVLVSSPLLPCTYAAACETISDAASVAAVA